MMDFDETSDFSADPRTPSGPWEGFWVHGDRIESMKLDLAFTGRRVIGDGTDPVGKFHMVGTYENHNRTIGIRKRYASGQEVWYRGRMLGNGFDGRWTMKNTTARGEWFIWPVEDAYTITHLEIETEDGPTVIYDDDEGDEHEEECECEEDDS